MDKQLKNILIGTGFGVVLFVVLTNLHVVLNAFFHVLHVLQPVIIGCILAFVLNVPMTKFSEKLTAFFSHGRRKLGAGAIRALSMVLTILIVAIVLALVCVVLIPQLISSATMAVRMLEKNIPIWISELEKLGIDADWLQNILSKLKLENLASTLTHRLSGFASSLVTTISSTLGTMANWLVALIIAFYLLVGKDSLREQCKKLFAAYLPERLGKGLLAFGNLVNDTYSKFFCGQCLEAVILGVLMFLAFTLFRLPYAGLVAVLTSVFSFIPYIGAIASCALGALLTLMVNPWKALISIAVYQVVQFCENQFIYPRVVGGSVGLPPLWTLVAVMVGGNLFGIVGMIFFIPLTAVFYTLLREGANRRIQARGGTGAEEENN